METEATGDAMRLERQLVLLRWFGGRLRRRPGGLRDPRQGPRPGVRTAAGRRPRDRARGRKPRDLQRASAGAGCDPAAVDRDRRVRARRGGAVWIGVGGPERARGPGVGDRIPDPARGRRPMGLRGGLVGAGVFLVEQLLQEAARAAGRGRRISGRVPRRDGLRDRGSRGLIRLVATPSGRRSGRASG